MISSKNVLVCVERDAIVEPHPIGGEVPFWVDWYCVDVIVWTQVSERFRQETHREDLMCYYNNPWRPSQLCLQLVIFVENDLPRFSYALKYELHTLNGVRMVISLELEYPLAYVATADIYHL